MNTLTTFNGLVAAIPLWTNRTDPTFISQVPNFINLGQQRIFTDCPTLASQVYVNGTFVPNNPIVSIPALWGSNLTFQYIDQDGNINVLQYMPLENVNQFNPISTGVSTQVPNPRYYTNMGIGYLFVSPTPTDALNFQIAYDSNSPTLTTQTQTNFITQNMYDLLFVASMSYAYIYLQNATQIQSWEVMYKERKESYLSYNTGRKFDRNTNMEKD